MFLLRFLYRFVDFFTYVFRLVKGLYLMCGCIGVSNMMALVSRKSLNTYNVTPVDIKGWCIPVGGDMSDFKTREDDVFVVAYPKSGHHWSYDFITMLMNGRAELGDKTKMAMHLEFYFNDLKAMDNKPSPRLIYTHLPTDLLPHEIFTKKRKVIRLIRNPKDVYVSFYHMASSCYGYKESWNTFIGTLMDIFEGKVEGKDAHKLARGIFDGWFKYERAAEEKINAREEHVLVLHYEDLKEDLTRELRKAARFLCTANDESFLADVACKASIDYVKKNKDLSLEKAVTRGGSFYRKGVVGDWKNHFTVAANKRFNDILRRNMDGSDLMDKIRFEI